MPTLETNGITQFYETYGERKNPPVMLITGLGGAGASWGPQIKRFAERYFVILPDHRGAGKSSRPADGYTIANHAADMAALVDHLGVGPAHLVGSSTGGCIAMAMCLDHAAAVRSAVVVSSFARMDAYMIRQFELRKKLIAQFSPRDAQDASALFLYLAALRRRARGCRGGLGRPRRVAADRPRHRGQAHRHDHGLRRARAPRPH